MPRSRLVRRDQAIRDLEEQSTFLLEESGLDVAVRFLEAAEETFARLLETLEIGARREFDAPDLGGLRMWPIPDFPNRLIFYRAIESGVEIVRILHAARDIPGILEVE